MAEKTPLLIVSGGRPSTFTRAVAEQIVAGLMEGRSLVQICLDPGMPNRSTVIRWMGQDEGFATECARARSEGAEVGFAKMAEIEADLLSGKLDPAAGRAVLSSMQWRLSKLAPRRFGDRLELAGVADQPLVVQRQETPLELARKVAFAIALAQADAGRQIEGNVRSADSLES